MAYLSTKNLHFKNPNEESIVSQPHLAFLFRKNRQSQRSGQKPQTGWSSQRWACHKPVVLDSGLVTTSHATVGCYRQWVVIDRGD
uniref:Uncharacterized protein n=1 Tax=Picea glauca TaxID=3330 RepID=A0A101M1P0_PICGL|nr:hypothetical protein ABT39_MTgene3821 [Picea glauca]QHR90820.1 hypothetical protein Q903MT_gene4846 [Picea sitchensis]